MTEVTLPYTLADGQKAYASRLMANFEAVITGINLACAAAEAAEAAAEYWSGREESLADGTGFFPAITDLTTESTIASGDYIPFYDVSASATRRSTWSNIKTKLGEGFAALENDKVAPAQASAAIVAVTADKTLALSDAGTLQTCCGAAANITVTIPANAEVAFPVGTEMEFVELSGEYTTTFAAVTGVTIAAKDAAALTIDGQYGGATLKKIATDTWLLKGELS